MLLKVKIIYNISSIEEYILTDEVHILISIHVFISPLQKEICTFSIHEFRSFSKMKTIF